ncbi:hypothetical protein SSZBM1_133 [Synechococcus phage S-SZBM1]|uniref:Uncharacterized protein n=1 Tax=Synechococcus phage S-SZBM1 TaxID=2926475 RepID=A0AC61TTS3_9CAUD|nr:hypothetical protein PP650_gp143 [Synechococcus phage S-SZBM1]UNH61250.1 hypothetical protein SSZBM1_133 [Synechococcus phage S-SZBM1]
MAFGSSKVAVLESKLNIYEDLSKEMLDKLERAVETISQNSQKVAVVLERHENRLEDTDKTHSMLLKMVEEIKNSNSADHAKVTGKINELENKIDELYKFRWIAVGIAVAAVTLINAPEIFGRILTPGHKTSMIPAAISVPYERS